MAKSTISVTFKLNGDAKSFQDLISQSDGLKKALDSAAVSADRVPKRMGMIQKSMKFVVGQIAGMTAGFMTVRAAMNGLKSAVTLIADFEKANSELAAVLGTSVDGVKELSDAAQVLGRSTKFTASEVTSLQTSLARLGFTSGQIQDMEEPVLKFAAAVGTDLGSAADFAGSALRSFGLQSKDTRGLLDMMAASTSKSALDFSKLQTSISIVGPVAKSFGLSASETVAFLGALSNAGFDASSAATALRNILLNLANANGKLAKGLGYTATTMPEIIAALRDLNGRGVNLNATLGMTDKKSVAAFSSFLAGVDTLDSLNEELKKVDGTLEKMYGTMSDNVTGSLDTLKSAWQGLILQMSESRGVIKGAIDLLTEFVNMANRAFFKNARVETAADFFTKELTKAMQNGGMEAAEEWYNSMMDTLDRKFKRGVNNSFLTLADQRAYNANKEGLDKSWAAIMAQYGSYGPEAPANLNAGGGGGTSPVDPGGSNKKAAKDLATAIADLRSEMAGAYSAAAAFGSEMDGEDAMLRTMKSGIEALIKKYGAESDAVRALKAEYDVLLRSRMQANVLPNVQVSGGGLTSVAMTQADYNRDRGKDKTLPDLAARTTEQKKYTASLEDTTTAINAISSAFSSMSGAVSESAAAWLDWISNVLSAVAQAVPAIAKLVVANKAEATANVAAGASAAGKSVANIPYVGPALAVAAIASFIAAMASVPKFAQGGLAYGPTFGLFGEYAGASHNPEVVAPLDKLRNMLRDTGSGAGTVDFRIKGRDLYGVLSTEGNIKKRS